MNVSRRSWHYRLHVFVFTVFNLEDYGPSPYFKGKRYDHVPRSLCGYFWSTAILVLLTPGLAVVAFFVYAVVFVIAVVFWGCDKTRDAFRTVVPAKPKPEPDPDALPKQPGLVRSYVKARKQKVCPIITLVD